MRYKNVLIVAGWLLGAPAAAVRVIDGDTLEIGGARVRLVGIDAPETGEPGAVEAEGGLALALHMASEILCLTSGRDRWGRAVARCWLGPEMLDLSTLLVRHGFALSDARFSAGRPAAQAAAQAEGAGLWACDAEAPPGWAALKAGTCR